VNFKQVKRFYVQKQIYVSMCLKNHTQKVKVKS